MKIKDLLEQIDNLRSIYPMLDEYDFDVMLDSNTSEVMNEEDNMVRLKDYTILSTCYPLELKVTHHHQVTLTNEL